MTEQITTELLKLQTELSSLSAAIEHIQKAEKISSEVVQATQNVSKAYPQHLQNLQNLHQQSIDNNNQLLENHVNDLVAHQKAQLEEMQHHLANFVRQISNNEQISAKRTEKTQLLAQEKLTELTASQKEQLDTINDVLYGYVELAQSTAKLNEKIEQINFPQELQSMAAKVDKMDEKLHKIKTEAAISTDQSTLELHKKITKQNKRINTLLFLIIVIFVAVAAITIENFMDYIPKEQVKTIQDVFTE